MIHPASIAQITNDPSLFPGPYHFDLFNFFFYIFFLVGIILVVKIWPQKSVADANAAAAASKPAQQAHEDMSESVYPPGMQIDVVLKELDEKKGGRMGAKCVVKI